MKHIWKKTLVIVGLLAVPVVAYAADAYDDGCECGSECPCPSDGGCPCGH